MAHVVPVSTIAPTGIEPGYDSKSRRDRPNVMPQGQGRSLVIGNVIVLFVALGVWGTATAWPDLAVASVMAAIFLTSSVQVLRQAWAEYRVELHQPQPEAS